MDNYDLTNSPLLRDCADSGEYHPLLTAEQNTPVPFSGRSATVSTLEQAELQHPFLTDVEQLSEQRVLADFDISLASNILNPLIVDEPVAGGSEDPFTVLATYHPLLTTTHNTPLTTNWAWARAFSKASLLKTSRMLYRPNPMGMMFLSSQSNLRANLMHKALSSPKVQRQILFQTSIQASGVRLNQEMCF